MSRKKKSRTVVKGNCALTGAEIDSTTDPVVVIVGTKKRTWIATSSVFTKNVLSAMRKKRKSQSLPGVIRHFSRSGITNMVLLQELCVQYHDALVQILLEAIHKDHPWGSMDDLREQIKKLMGGKNDRPGKIYTTSPQQVQNDRKNAVLSGATKAKKVTPRILSRSARRARIVRTYERMVEQGRIAAPIDDSDSYDIA